MRDEASPKVGIVILNWNRPGDTIACIESLERMNYANYEVVVVDNASRDDSVAQLRSSFSSLHVIANSENLGFAAGNNVGIGYLMSRKCDYIMLLNDDAEVAPDTIQTLIDVAESDASIGIVGPTICYFDQPRVIWSAGGGVSKHGEPYHLDADNEIEDGHLEPRDVDYVTGCAILVKRSVIERLGGLDERYFIYFEETEWCARTRRAGFRVVHVPDAIMWHKITPTARIFSHRYLYLMTRNRLLYLQCVGAGTWRTLEAVCDQLRTAASWLIRPCHRPMRGYSLTLVRGVLAFVIGRYGAPPVGL